MPFQFLSGLALWELLCTYRPRTQQYAEAVGQWTASSCFVPPQKEVHTDPAFQAHSKLDYHSVPGEVEHTDGCWETEVTLGVH